MTDWRFKFFDDLLTMTEEPTLFSLCNITLRWCFVVKLLPHLVRCLLFFRASPLNLTSLSLTSPISLTTPLTLELFFNIYIVLYSSPHGHTFEFIIFVSFHSFNSFVLPHHTLNFFILKSPLLTFCPHAHSPQKHVFIIIVIIFVAFLNEKLK